MVPCSTPIQTDFKIEATTELAYERLSSNPNAKDNHIGLSTVAMQALFGSTEAPANERVLLGEQIFRPVCISILAPTTVALTRSDNDELRSTARVLSKISLESLITTNETIYLEPMGNQNLLVENKKAFKRQLVEFLSGRVVKSHKDYSFYYDGTKIDCSFSTLRGNEKCVFAQLTPQTKVKLRRRNSSYHISFLDKAVPLEAIKRRFILNTPSSKTTILKEKVFDIIKERFLGKSIRYNQKESFSYNGTNFYLTFTGIENEPISAKFLSYRFDKFENVHLDRESCISFEEPKPELTEPIQRTPVEPKKSVLRASFAKFLEKKGMCGVSPGLVKALNTVVAFFGGDKRLRELAKSMGVSTGSLGILLYGPPGNGKTKVVEYVAEYLGVREDRKFFKAGTQLLEGVVGETEKKIRALFNQAHKDVQELGENAPLNLFFIDEIDGIVPDRSASNLQSYMTPQVNEFLTSLGKAMELGNVVFFAATNRYHSLDNALLRWGRLGTHIEIPNPNEELRAKLFETYFVHLNQKHLLEKMDLKDLAKMSEEFSAADIEGVVKTLGSDHFSRVMDKILSGEMTLEQAEQGPQEKIKQDQLVDLIIKKHQEKKTSAVFLKYMFEKLVKEIRVLERKIEYTPVYLFPAQK